MPRDRKTELEYQVLKAMMEGMRNPSEILAHVVSRGFTQDEVVGMMRHVVEKGYVEITIPASFPELLKN